MLLGAPTEHENGAQLPDSDGTSALPVVHLGMGTQRLLRYGVQQRGCHGPTPSLHNHRRSAPPLPGREFSWESSVFLRCNTEHENGSSQLSVE